MDQCPICETPGEPQAHFGGSSCRACAAFFRRYVNSTKMMITCTCNSRKKNSHRCRHCRMMKCIEAGMNRNYVQGFRDKNSNRPAISSTASLRVFPSICLLKHPELSPMTCCLVCGSPDAEPHFGAISCRACAAFFRRYFHSKKSIVSCTCPIRFRNSHPCRECRIKKCLSIGMDSSKVQEKREKHAPKRGKLEKEPLRQVLCNSSESPPSLPMSPISYQIVPRDNCNISHTAAKWLTIQHKRYQIYNKTIDKVTYYETCCQSRTDTFMMWQVVESIFPEVECLSDWDRAAILRNFMPKWSLLVAAIDFDKNVKMYDHIQTKEDYDEMIVQFYTSSIPEDKKMSAEDILRVFEPFLRYYGLSLALPIREKAFDGAEYMALALLFLFDPAYTNLSEECVELCHRIRRLIFRELKSYQMDKGCDEMRFLDTIDTLTLLEKGEAKFQEELLLCEMHNVHIHEDYRLMMNQQNY